jgi:anaerobic ribonucleoside-triphosphate reductase activating protein
MGGDNDVHTVLNLVWECSDIYPDLKWAWYSGRHKLYDIFDYVKIGPYMKDRGGLDNVNTNQRLFIRIASDLNNDLYYGWEDITYKLQNATFVNDSNIS